MKADMRILLLPAIAVLFLCGCQGPETRILPRQNVSPEQPYELTGAETVLEEVNPFYLQEALDFLSAAPRVCGSAQETNAAEYMKRLLIEYGYDVSIQRFPVASEGPPQYGTNVSAVKESTESDGDILLVTTSHDSIADSPGANDNASGVVALLETARLIAKMPSDTEIRFVSFSGADHGRQGIRYYMKHLPGEERERIIGAIHLDTLGYIYDYGIVMGTADGNPTLLGALMEHEAGAELEQQWPYRMDDQGIYIVFDRYRIPAVRITQDITAFEQGTPQDRTDIVNVEKIGEVSRVLSQTLAKIMQKDTPSYLKASQEGIYYRDGALIQRTDRILPFGQTREAVEDYYGGAGVLLEPEASLPLNTEEYSGDLDAVVYQYQMKWLAVDQIILSEFIYQEGLLARVVLRAQESGIESAEIRQRLEQLYGTPVLSETGDETDAVWHDPVGNVNFMITEHADGYWFEAVPGQAEAHTFSIYPFGEGIQAGVEAVFPENGDVPIRDSAVLEMAGLVFTPEERERIAGIAVFTDGFSGSRIYWSGGEDQPEKAETEFGASLMLYLDREDITEPDGSYRDYNESLRQLVRAKAYLYREPYSGLFYENFDKTIGDEFDAAFQAFMLTNRPESDRLEADARTLFFYQFEPLAAVRSELRRQINLPL